MMTLRAVVVGTLLALFFSDPRSAAGQQSKDQQGCCINTLNKGMANVSATQFKEVAKCVKAYAKDPSAANPYSCITGSMAVDAAKGKTTIKLADKGPNLAEPASAAMAEPSRFS